MEQGEPDDGEKPGDRPAGAAVVESLARIRPVLDHAERMRRASLARVRGDSPADAAAARTLGLGVDPELLRDAVGDEDDPARALARADEALDRQREQSGPEPVYPASAAMVAFALDPAVSGVDADGRSLARQRLERVGVGALDERIARNISRYLQTSYAYSLDVTDARRSADQDPMDWFVGPDGHRGHCEYFAGTLALACQALGIPARVVVGFKTDEFNASMGRYVVRQSHAHAWVEVLTARGWQSLDPTSGNGDDAISASGGFGQRVRQWFEFLQYTWANNVVAYDNGTRENLLQNLESRVVTGEAGGGLWNQFQQWLERQNLYIYSVQVMAWLIVAALVVLCGAVAWFALERWRLRRRARRMGLRDLPPDEAKRLARQLAFYDELLRLLGRHGHRRRASQTPREFAGSLASLPAEAFAAVGGLTEVFYRVRYGRGRLTPRRQRWLGRTLETLAATLERA